MARQEPGPWPRPAPNSGKQTEALAARINAGTHWLSGLAKPEEGHSEAQGPAAKEAVEPRPLTRAEIQRHPQLDAETRLLYDRLTERGHAVVWQLPDGTLQLRAGRPRKPKPLRPFPHNLRHKQRRRR